MSAHGGNLSYLRGSWEGGQWREVAGPLWDAEETRPGSVMKASPEEKSRLNQKPPSGPHSSRAFFCLSTDSPGSLACYCLGLGQNSPPWIPQGSSLCLQHPT